MQPIPSDVRLGDVWQWLNGGWFIHESEAGRRPAQLEQYNEDEFVVRTVDGDEYTYERDSCFPHWPACGAVNVHGFAVIVDRQQMRQYRRTYNSRCVLVDIPRKWDVMKRHEQAKRMTPDTPELVEAVFDPQYYSYTRALELLGAGWASVALNPYLVVVGKPEKQLIYYRSKLLAEIQEGRLIPLQPDNPRNRRVLKWFDGRVSYAVASNNQQPLRTG